MAGSASEHREKMKRYAGMWIYYAISGKKGFRVKDFLSWTCVSSCPWVDSRHRHLLKSRCLINPSLILHLSTHLKKNDISVFPQRQYSHLREGYISENFIFPDSQHTMDVWRYPPPILLILVWITVYNAYTMLLVIGVSSGQFNTGFI